MTKTETTTKTTRYYAAVHQYGIEFCNDVTSIVRFESRALRDEFVESEEFDGSYHREAVSASVARRYFPKAFRLDDNRDGMTVLDSRDWVAEDDHEVFAAYRMSC